MKRANVAVFVPHLGCPHQCSFCNQREIAGRSDIPGSEDVRKAARIALEHLGERAEKSEIAFFGGSFTAIDRGMMVSLLESAKEFVGKGGFKGIRVSTRPDAVDAEVLTVLKEYGVTSVELGAQSMDGRVLELNGRGHTPSDVEKASRLIQNFGFELGLQMMTGLYGSTSELDRVTAEKLAAIAPQTMRVYPTLVLKNTRLEELYRSGIYTPPTIEETVELCAGLLEFFRVRGIRVIRLGLHAGKSLSDSYVAGPWHPAFRELCEGHVYYKKAKEALIGLKGTSAVIRLPRGDLSKLTGRGGKYVAMLESETGLTISVKETELTKYSVEVSAV